jgi:short-subunit dehydrogenase
MNKNYTKSAIITGASRGIGRETAFGLARRGYKLCLAARDMERLREISTEINNSGGECHYIQCDVKSRNEVKNAFEFAKGKLGRIGYAYLNAGTGGEAAFPEFNTHDYKQVFRTNLYGVLYFMEELIPHMRANGGGSIAGISSLADKRGFPKVSAYNASKSALGITLESARIELAPYNINVTTIRPGFVNTELVAQNKNRMPFIMEPAKAAEKIIWAVENGKKVYSFPFLMNIMTKIFYSLPDFIFDSMMKKAAK